VDMFGHEHKRPDRKIAPGPCRFNGFSQPRTRPLGIEKSIPAVTCEGKLVGMPRLIVCPSSRPFSVLHSDKPTRDLGVRQVAGTPVDGPDAKTSTA
jgi:hypothetical protein